METPKQPPKFEGNLPDAIKLSELSTDTLEVLDHFGPEAPHLLNQYCIKLEDALIEVVNKHKEQSKELERLRKLLDDNNIEHSA